MKAREQTFVSEAISPEMGSADIGAMARGEPGLPRAFTWRGRRYEITSVIATWKTTGTDRGDIYIRRHWYEIGTAEGQRMKIYFERNPTGRRRRGVRWWLYTVGAREGGQ